MKSSQAKYILLVIGSVAVAVTFVSASSVKYKAEEEDKLTCWTCQGAPDSLCGNKFNGEPNIVVQTRKCANTTHVVNGVSVPRTVPATACVKITSKSSSSGATVFERSCISPGDYGLGVADTPAELEGCVQIKQDEGAAAAVTKTVTRQLCFCKGNNCNGSSRLQMNVQTTTTTTTFLAITIFALSYYSS